MNRPTMQWILALILTVVIAVFQRMTGPTYPLSVLVTLNGQEQSFRLPRSGETGRNEPIILLPGDPAMQGEMRWKRFPTNDEWTTVPLNNSKGELRAELPSQPSAGKVAYQLFLKNGEGTMSIPQDGPVIMRFKGAVPLAILIVHVIVMFSAMLLTVKTALLALGTKQRMKEYVLITTCLLFVGGLILGPIVQKYAFGAYWTGWPFGHDLTDNKTLIAFIAWGLAAISLRRSANPSRWVLGAAIVTLIVFLIPHSLLGSEFDYNAAKGF